MNVSTSMFNGITPLVDITILLVDKFIIGLNDIITVVRFVILVVEDFIYASTI
ncbi:hypothetical protein M0G43_09170 [Subsaxibacter sp. CAU 1640]|uniref:hypothetical protein n=1 Tax=Subsaxibacter sp. CAU 1640 TaxID=2933271 RepID=UPI002004D6CC|nr:hypothetical protein [Subsaxibacter sp. CAU 1640]MCK7590743.1 hypothetical protein [Subsaxibacter sp. CAU 1640]